MKMSGPVSTNEELKATGKLQRGSFVVELEKEPKL